MIFAKVYSFEAVEKIENGKNVYMLDRKYAVTDNVSNLTIEEFAEIIRQEKIEPTRFEFWTEIETEEKENA